MLMQRYSDQQIPLNSMIHISLKQPKPPTLESISNHFNHRYLNSFIVSIIAHKFSSGVPGSM